jgi:hypothetical protein
MQQGCGKQIARSKIELSRFEIVGQPVASKLAQLSRQVDRGDAVRGQPVNSDEEIA